MVVHEIGFLDSVGKAFTGAVNTVTSNLPGPTLLKSYWGALPQIVQAGKTAVGTTVSMLRPPQQPQVDPNALALANQSGGSSKLPLVLGAGAVGVLLLAVLARRGGGESR